MAASNRGMLDSWGNYWKDKPHVFLVLSGPVTRANTSSVVACTTLEIAVAAYLEVMGISQDVLDEMGEGDWYDYGDEWVIRHAAKYGDGYPRIIRVGLKNG